jgi:multidrug efflux pump subunit AcrA (membrane-fusion protein)
MTAELHFAEHPGKVYPAKVQRTANAIDPTTRTMLVQLIADNANGELLPGSYADVHFQLPLHADALRVPDNTLLFRGSNIQVASVDAKGQVALKTITLGRDFGKEVEVLTGITGKDSLIINPPDSIADGDSVRPVEAKPDQPVANKGGAAK